MSFFATSFDRVCYLCQNYTCNFDNGLHNDGPQTAASIDMHFTQKHVYFRSENIHLPVITASNLKFIKSQWK